MMAIIFICSFLVVFSPNVNQHEAFLQESDACYETRNKHHVAIKFNPGIDEKPFALKVAAEVFAKEDKKITPSKNTIYHLKLVPGRCSSTLTFGANKGKFPNAELLYNISIFTPGSNTAFSVVQFIANQSLPYGLYKFRDNQDLLYLFAQVDQTADFLITELSSEPDYFTEFGSTPYDEKCLCAIDGHRRHNLRLVDGEDLMIFEGQYGTIFFDLSVQTTLNTFAVVFSKSMAAFPCACRPTDGTRTLGVILPKDFEAGKLTITLDNISGGLNSASEWAITKSTTSFNSDISAFDISNLLITRASLEILKVNAPNILFMGDFTENVRKCGPENSIRTTTKYVGDDIYEFKYEEIYYVYPGKISQMLTYYENVAICRQ